MQTTSNLFFQSDIFDTLINRISFRLINLHNDTMLMKHLIFPLYLYCHPHIFTRCKCKQFWIVTSLRRVSLQNNTQNWAFTISLLIWGEMIKVWCRKWTKQMKELVYFQKGLQLIKQHGLLTMNFQMRNWRKLTSKPRNKVRQILWLEIWLEK